MVIEKTVIEILQELIGQVRLNWNFYLFLVFVCTSAAYSLRCANGGVKTGRFDSITRLNALAGGWGFPGSLLTCLFRLDDTTTTTLAVHVSSLVVCGRPFVVVCLSNWLRNRSFL